MPSVRDDALKPSLLVGGRALQLGQERLVGFLDVDPAVLHRLDAVGALISWPAAASDRRTIELQPGSWSPNGRCYQHLSSIAPNDWFCNEGR